MYRLVTVLAVIFVWFSAVHSQEFTEVIIHDFGEVSANQVLNHRFVFDHKIETAVSLCECVTAVVNKDKSGRYSVDVEFDLIDYSGFEGRSC